MTRKVLGVAASNVIIGNSSRQFDIGHEQKSVAGECTII